MQRTHIYLPDDLDSKIELTAKIQRKSKAEVIREALEQGMKAMQPQKSQSAKALLDLGKRAETFDVSGPKDLSENHDYYTWGGEKRNPTAEE